MTDPQPTDDERDHIFVLEGHYHGEGSGIALVRAYRVKANADRDLALLTEFTTDRQWTLHPVPMYD